jgi:hypothetical protein
LSASCASACHSAGTAHSLMLEEPVPGAQFNLDGYAFAGTVHALGVVDAIHYPGTQAFMRFVYPSTLARRAGARARRGAALSVSGRF